MLSNEQSKRKVWENIPEHWSSTSKVAGVGGSAWPGSRA